MLPAAHSLFQDDHETFQSAVDVLQQLNGLCDGDYMDKPAGDDELSQTVSRLAGLLRERAGSTMSNVVEISIRVNETACMTARLLHTFRNTDGQIQEMASTAEEMASSVVEIGRHGAQIKHSVETTGDAVASSEKALAVTTEKMDVIAKAVEQTSIEVSSIQTFAKQITEISSDIKRIAAQTNLLAINAAVEASRAGDAGRGFAVVAAEIKALSDRTTKATGEIAGIVGNLHTGVGVVVASMGASDTAVKDGNSAVQNLADAIAKVDESMTAVTGNAAHISEALKQQEIASQQIARGVAEIATNSTQSTQALERVVDAMDSAQSSLTHELAQISEVEVPNKIIKLAQSDHVIWKKRLANMMIGKAGLRAQELADHHSCRLGKWYDKVTDPELTGHPAFKKLAQPHALVHQHGIEAVRQYGAGNIQSALDHIEMVEEVSKDVLSLLRQLERR
jgi:methyl-accepting chemotaxis protein